MDPEPLAVMGSPTGPRHSREQLRARTAGGRYVISLVGFRSIHEFIFHRPSGRRADPPPVRHQVHAIPSVRYPRNGKPQFITDVAFAEADFQQQLAFWFDQMPGR